MLGRPSALPDRRGLKHRVRRVPGEYEFNPWERNPTAVEATSLTADRLTSERLEGKRFPRRGRGQIRGTPHPNHRQKDPVLGRAMRRIDNRIRRTVRKAFG